MENIHKCMHLLSERFAKMRGSGDYYVTVIEDTRKNEIIGAATLVIEHKFIHDCGEVCICIEFLSLWE